MVPARVKRHMDGLIRFAIPLLPPARKTKQLSLIEFFLHRMEKTCIAGVNMDNLPTTVVRHDETALVHICNG